jgi:predicted membrane protein
MISEGTQRKFIGLLIVAVGVGYLVEMLIGWNFGAFFSNWWPAIIILIGLSNYATSTSKVFPSILIVIGMALLLTNLEIVEIGWNTLWPLILILIGLSFLFKTNPSPNKNSIEGTDMVAVFGGYERIITDKNFSGGEATAVFGSIKLDLTQAGLKDRRASLSVTTVFGGVVLIVPKEWRVKSSGVPIFGGFDDRTVSPSDPDAPELFVDATAVFGGVEIKN